MSELKPCPMTADEAISALEMCQALMLFDPMTGETHELCEENKDNQDLYNACSLAIDALRRVQPANEPLTLEQLKKMDGEPVWCADGEGHSCYCLVNAESEDCIDSECGAWCFEFYGMTGEGENGLHNMGWLAYRRPPEMFIGVDLASVHDFTAYGRPPERSENDA